MQDRKIHLGKIQTYTDYSKNARQRRSKKVVFVVSLFAMLSHMSFLLLFYLLKVFPMFYFNFFSVALFAGVVISLRSYSSFLGCYLICTTEVIIHQLATVWIIGTASGFHFLIILVGILPFLVLEDYPKLSIFFSVMCSIVFMLIEILLKNHLPVMNIAPNILFFLRCTIILVTILILYIISMVFIKNVHKAEHDAFEQYIRAEHLLCNILPDSIAEKLKISDATIAESYESVSVLFLDIVNFTQFSSKLSAENLVKILNTLFSQFDILSSEYHVEKIKTIGDAYMVAAGIPLRENEHCHHIAEFALRLLESVRSFNQENNTDIQVRIGIHCGPVVAGIIGLKKFIYDLWGSTVNYASRMESSSKPGRIQASEAVYETLKNDFEFHARNPIKIKGCGICSCYFLIGKKDNRP